MVVPTGVQVVLEPVPAHSLAAMANEEEATCCTAKDDDDEGQDREGDREAKVDVRGAWG